MKINILASSVGYHIGLDRMLIDVLVVLCNGENGTEVRNPCQLATSFGL